MLDRKPIVLDNKTISEQILNKTILITGAAGSTLLQIQPILDNTDPLNILVGNPELQQAFTNKFTFNIGDYKVLKSRSINLWVDYGNTNNAITSSSEIDANGRRISKYVNVDGNFNYSINGKLILIKKASTTTTNLKKVEKNTVKGKIVDEKLLFP